MGWAVVLPVLLVIYKEACAEIDQAYGDRPRGVPFSRKALYDVTKPDFVCIDGSKKIPFDQVNDDYCDCADGSDEPGTSACPNARFHCINLGHQTTDIPSSRVNDGICDCCDGSDEWADTVECPNVCAVVGAKAREQEEKRIEKVKTGWTARQELAKEGKKLKEEKQKVINAQKIERDALLPQRDEIETRKKTAEELEKTAKDRQDNEWNAFKEARRREKASRIFGQLDKNADQKITVDEIQARKEFDTDNDGTVSEDEAKAYLSGVDESSMDHFLEHVYGSLRHTFKDDDSPPPPVTTPAPTTIEPTEKPDDGKDEEEIDGDDNDDDKKTDSTNTYMDEVQPPYDDETQKLIDAANAIRQEYSDVDNKIREFDDNIKDAETFIETDFGDDLSWAPLKDKCFELDESQYIYKLCVFDRTVQKEKNGHSDVTLGKWKEWSGPEHHRYSKQSYHNGLSCWNGPERSTEVIVECSDETKLIAASEPGRCEYRFVLETPVVCPDPQTLHQTHGEL